MLNDPQPHYARQIQCKGGQNQKHTKDADENAEPENTNTQPNSKARKPMGAKDCGKMYQQQMKMQQQK